MTIGRFFFRWLIELPIALLLISVIIFMLIHLVPGDPISSMVGPSVTEEQMAALRAKYALSDPLVVQYGRWLGQAVHLDLGNSIRTSEAVRDMIGDRLPASLTLAGLAMAWALIIGLPLGVLAAVRRNTLVDYGASLLAILGQSIPNFVIAVVLVLVLAVRLRLVPVSVRGNLLADPLGTLPSYFLPTLTLGLSYAAQFMRLTRASTLEVLGQSYIVVARAKGLTERMVVLQHAMRNSMIPVVTVIGTSFVYMLGSAIIIEQIFNVPGVGNLLVRAVIQRDIPVVQGIALTISLLFVVVNGLVDLAYVILDPRLSE